MEHQRAFSSLDRSDGHYEMIYAITQQEIVSWLREIQRADYEIFMPNNESRAQTQILEAP